MPPYLSTDLVGVFISLYDYICAYRLLLPGGGQINSN